MQQNDKEPSSTMLYVSNLPFSFQDADLKGVFNGFEVASAYVATRRNGRSKGFGFVTFVSSDQQKKALDAFDGKELSGRKLTVKVAHKDDRRDAKGELKDEFKNQEPREPRRGGNGGGRRQDGAGDAAAEKEARAPAADKKPSETILYVSNLPFEFSDDDLKKVFAAHNPVSARIARRRNKRSKGFGFVEFPSKKEQTAALALDGQSINDRPIAVKVSLVGDELKDGGDSKPQQEKKAAAPKQEKQQGERKQQPKKKAEDAKEGAGSNTTLYVSNLPFDLTDEGLAEIFTQKGFKPVSARVARRRDDRSKGFGFVEFANQEAQSNALKAVDGATIKDRPISAKVAMKDSETRGDGAAAGGNANDNNRQDDDGKRKRNRTRKPKAEGEGADAKPAAEKKKPVEKKEKKDSERLVYVSNLSFDVDDNALAKLFDGLTIKSAHVAVRRNGKSKGFGFVEFVSQADQKKALGKNGVELNGRKLVVEIAKEDAQAAEQKKE